VWTGDVSIDLAPRCDPARVLVVDDDPCVLRTAIRVLTRAGLVVEQADSSAAAERKLTDHIFDVVLSDVHMPGISGLDLFQRARERDPDVQLILVTGAPELESALRSIEVGAYRYLTKPFGVEELGRVVTEAAAVHHAEQLKRSAMQRLEHKAAAKRELRENLAEVLATLFIAYQPIVEWSTRSIYAYEALLRARSEALPHPGAILSAAERLRSLPLLGSTIRARIAADLERCPVETVFANLHPSDLLDESLFSPTAPLSGVARRIVLEITERAALDGISDVRARIERLRELGFRIAIDDLGAGYAALASVAQLEPEIVKLDMSIIRGVDCSRPNQRLIKAIVAIARDAGAKLIAEGVETAAERDALLDLGCRMFQGFLFAKPAKDFPTVAW
jgi:EAL domain-containing protein (putative c-di-GMP-specific phosphodiesterase class I)